MSFQSVSIGRQNELGFPMKRGWGLGNQGNSEKLFLFFIYYLRLMRKPLTAMK